MGDDFGPPLELSHPVDGDRGVELGSLSVEERLGREFVAQQPQVLFLGSRVGNHCVQEQTGFDGCGQEGQGGFINRAAAAEPGQQLPLGLGLEWSDDAQGLDGTGYAALWNQLERR